MLDPRTERRKWLRAGLVLGVPPLLFALLASLPFPVCQSRLVLGIPCAGCGLTRATRALLAFDFEASFRFHPLALPVVGFLAALMAMGALRELGREPPPWLRRLASAKVAVILGVALVVVFLVRLGGGLGGLPDPVEPRAPWVARIVAVAGGVLAHTTPDP